MLRNGEPDCLAIALPTRDKRSLGEDGKKENTRQQILTMTMTTRLTTNN